MGFLKLFSSKKKHSNSNFYQKKYQYLKSKFSELKAKNHKLTQENQKLQDYCEGWDQHCQCLATNLKQKETELKDSYRTINLLRNEIRRISERIERIEEDSTLQSQNHYQSPQSKAKDMLRMFETLSETLGYSVQLNPHFDSSSEEEVDYLSRVNTISTTS